MRTSWLAVGLCLAAAGVRAEDVIKVGVVAPFSGPFADYGKEMETGIKAWQQQHGDTVAGKRIEVIVRDTTGPVPEVARRLAQELVVRDHVDFLAGFGLTPEALAAAEVATQAKKPMIVMNAATSIITTKSPYIARVSMTLPQISAPLGAWAAKHGLTSVYTLVSDYGPGIDAEAAFTRAFTGAGGKVAGSVRVPLQNPEFASYVQRIKDAAPKAVFVFVPAGQQGIAFMKAFEERGLKEAGIQVIATGDLTDDDVLDTMGDVSLGILTAFHYSAAHDSPENQAFQKAAAAAGTGVRRPNFMAVAGYDGMAAIYHVIEATQGKVDGEGAMKALQGWKRESPRGPIAIDPATRDIVQDVYLRRVEKRGDHYFNVEFDKVAAVKDPGKGG
jgi:branched-chain amino acid transport system substrate-binding protein